MVTRVRPGVYRLSRSGDIFGASTIVGDTFLLHADTAWNWFTGQKVTVSTTAGSVVKIMMTFSSSLSPLPLLLLLLWCTPVKRQGEYCFGPVRPCVHAITEKNHWSDIYAACYGAPKSGHILTLIFDLMSVIFKFEFTG